jgi:tRNA(Ile)-lysidine synthase
MSREKGRVAPKAIANPGVAMPSVVGDAALLRAFSCLEPFPSAVLAVSGGPDSMALMSLACHWAGLNGRALASFSVVTIDHGLRPESVAEAAFVAEQARGMGLSHATIAWAGEKPKTGLQAAARQARYDLLFEFCAARAIGCVVTAHTADDQAETFLMRLRRGSGVDGLAGMATVSHRGALALVRPLLGFSKARLTAYLRATSTPFIQDPSNENEAFERVRLRRAMKALAGAGIGRASLTMAASRIGRSRYALVKIVDDFLSHHFRVSSLGRGECGLEAFQTLPEDIALRVLTRAVDLIGGEQEAPRLMRTERLLESLRAGNSHATLGGCVVLAEAGALRFYRERGRLKTTSVPFTPGATTLWDDRFILTFASKGNSETTVRQLGADGWIIYKNAMKERGAPVAPDRLAALTTPALWKGNCLVCAPALGLAAEAAGDLPNPMEATLAPRLAAFLTAASDETASMLGKGAPIPYL